MGNSVARDKETTWTMEQAKSPRASGTPEASAAGEDDPASTPATTATMAPKTHAVKDRKCQYCHQAFTSSSLGRHLDQFLFKKKTDGIHDVEEIRRVRSSITRRQARTSASSHLKRDLGSPERTESKNHESGVYRVAGHGQDSDFQTRSKTRDGGVRMIFNTPTWHATGVINDIPIPRHAQDASGYSSSYFSMPQSRPSSLVLPDYASRGATANNPDTARALELALREVLDNIKAAT